MYLPCRSRRVGMDENDTTKALVLRAFWEKRYDRKASVLLIRRDDIPKMKPEAYVRWRECMKRDVIG